MIEHGLTGLGAGVPGIVVDLDTPVPVGQAMPWGSSSGSDSAGSSRSLVSVELVNESGGNWTQVALDRDLDSSHTTETAWSVISSPKLTVQVREIVMNGTADGTASFDAVTLSQAFLSVFSRTSGGNMSRGPARVRFTGPTGVEAHRASSSDTCTVLVYIGEYEGAVVSSGNFSMGDADSSVPAALSPTVVLANTFLLYNWYGGTTTRADRFFVSGEITGTDEATFERGGFGTGEGIEGHFFAVHHADFTVQRGTMAATGATDTDPLSPAVDPDVSFAPAPQVGRGRSSATGLNSLTHGWSHIRIIDPDTVGTEREGTDGTLTVPWEVVTIATGPDPATISRKAVVIGDDPRNDDVTVVAEIDSVDGTADHHDSYGHTSDLGSDPASWVASATSINAPQNPANDIAWGSRSPNTSYWIALISDDGEGNLSISNRVEIVTAPARSTGVSATSVESDSIRVQGTDATGGAFEHRYLRRLTASGGYSEVAVSPAGDPVDHTFDNLDPSTEYGLAVITTDLTEPARISAVVEVIETTLPDVTYEIKIELDPSEIDFPEEESVEQPLPVQYAVFNSPNPSQWLSPAFFGTSEIDVDGVFTLDVTGTLVADDIVFVYLTSLTEDQVTAWEADTGDLSLVEHRHHGGPAVVTEVIEEES